MSAISLLRIAVCAFSLAGFVPPTADAAIDKVTVNTSRDFENAAGYTYAEITIDGSVMRADGTAGQYSVPAVIIYPRHGHGNGVGVVDWLTTSFYHFFPATTDANTIQFTRLTTENYLFEEGYTYLSIQWDKAITEIFGRRRLRTMTRPTISPTAPSSAVPMRGKSCWMPHDCSRIRAPTRVDSDPRESTPF